MVRDGKKEIWHIGFQTVVDVVVIYEMDVCIFRCPHLSSLVRKSRLVPTENAAWTYNCSCKSCIRISLTCSAEESCKRHYSVPFACGFSRHRNLNMRVVYATQSKTWMIIIEIDILSSSAYRSDLMGGRLNIKLQGFPRSS